ncbi:hypothetical protein [Sandarakinorhabdus sp.]|uniref:hypothetical protein n=1 Tax=Sandarakinorhabdus sp. TaxID=1916663 RepID=UPI00286DC474|nr:hypothetical protein [Sandarakinorhabdus sp.]
MEEFRAMSVLSRARSGLLVNTFGGTQLKFGSAHVLDDTKKLLTTGKKLKSGGQKLAQGGQAATQTASQTPGIKQAIDAFITQCADVENIAEIAAVIGSEALADLIAEVAPYIGILWSGKKLAQATKAVVEDGYNLYKQSYRREGFRVGDPVAAADAITTIIQRDLTRHSIDLARQTVATGAKIGGLFADFGTATTAAIGIGNALAGLGLQLYALGLDIKDMRAGNKRLKTPDTLDATVFGECPILGCYLLTCADTSSVINMFIADIGLPGWQDRIEKLKKDKMDPLLKISKKAIKASHLQLEGLQSNKGTINEKGFFASIKSKVAHKVMGR